MTFTLKGDGSYGAPWAVFYGDTVLEALDLVQQFEATAGAAILARANEQMRALQVAGAGLGAQPVTPPAAATPPLPPIPPAAPAPPPQAAPQGPPGNVPTCIHGQRKYKESKPGASRPWKAYMCPTPQGTADQCAPQWL